MILKKDIINRLAEKGYTKTDAGVLLDDVLDIIMEELVEGNEVHLHGFGNFSIISVDGHDGFNVSKNAVVTMPGYKRVQFKSGAVLRRGLKDGYISKL